MTQPSIFAALPAPLAEAMRELHWPDPEYFAKVGRIFESVAFPTDVCGVRAETLTAEQRAVAIALTELDLPSPLRSTTVPAHRAVRRRWLGLDPAGPLEQITTFIIGDVTYVEPVWRMLRIIVVAQLWNQMPHEDYGALRRRFDAQFTLDERLRLWGEVNSAHPYIWDLPSTAFFNWGEDTGLIDQLRGEGAAWAAAFLDRLVEANADTRFRDLVPAFMALVRAGVSIARWDSLLVLHRPFAREVLRMLPEAQRARSALDALKRVHPQQALLTAIEILPVLPDVALAAYALGCIPKAMGSPRKHRRALREAAGTHADILALLDAADAAAGPPLVLTPTRERSIAEEGTSAVFSELDKEQLLVCGKRYLGGKGAPLEVLLAENPTGPDEERSLRGQLFYRAIADAKGKHVYDAWLYQTDSGTIFKAGTARVAAEVVHFSVTCKDDRLAEALEEALRAEPSAVVAAPKKKAAKHP